MYLLGQLPPLVKPALALLSTWVKHYLDPLQPYCIDGESSMLVVFLLENYSASCSESKLLHLQKRDFTSTTDTASFLA